MRILNTIAAGMFASTALISAAQAAGSMSGDANGEELVNPSVSTEVEAKIEGDATPGETPEYVTGDANGEEKVQPGAAVNAQAAAEAPVSSPKDMVGDADGDVTPLTGTQKMAAADMDIDGQDVMTVDGKTVGEVSAVNVAPDGTVASIDADVGGFLGLGATTVTIPAERFDVASNGVQLNMTKAELEVLADS